MARVAEWTVTETSGRQHRVLVDRVPLLGVRVSVDRRRLERFDQTPETDRYVTSLAGHVLTVNAPRAANDQATLHVDGKPVLGTETTLPAPVVGTSDTTGQLSAAGTSSASSFCSDAARVAPGSIGSAALRS